MRLLRSIAAGMALACCVTGARTADMATPGMTRPAPLWSGFYLGLHGGWGAADASGYSFDGLLGGGGIGFNAQLGPNLIAGLEADLSGADIGRTDSGTAFGLATSVTTHANVLGTARGRLGVTFDRFMIYGAGGFAWVVNRLSATVGGVSASDTQVHTGFTIGGGVEWMVAPAWTVRAEYLYANFGSRSYFGGAAATGTVEANIVRAGVNYLFQ